jgi:hypothetical protein
MHDDIDVLGTAVIDGVPAPPPVEGVHRRLAARRRRRARLLGATVAVAALGLGGLAIAQSAGDPTTDVATEGGEQAEPPPPPDEPMDLNASIPVGDGEQTFGSVKRADQIAAARNVGRRAREIFGERDPETDEDRAVIEALMVLEALPVTDDAGELTGYWAQGFIPAEQYPDERARAEQVVEAFTG